MSINITENLGGEVKFFETLHGSIRSEELYCVFNDSNYLYANLDGYVDESYRRMVSMVVSETGVITQNTVESIEQKSLNSMFKSSGYLPYSYINTMRELDDYARSFFKLVQFKDE